MADDCEVFSQLACMFTARSTPSSLSKDSFRGFKMGFHKPVGGIMAATYGHLFHCLLSGYGKPPK